MDTKAMQISLYLPLTHRVRDTTYFYVCLSRLELLVLALMTTNAKNAKKGYPSQKKTQLA